MQGKGDHQTIWRMQIIALVGVIIAGSCGIAKADHPTVGFGSGIAGPAITIPATTLPKGNGSVALRVEYIKFSAFSDAELGQFARKAPMPTAWIIFSPLQ